MVNTFGTADPYRLEVPELEAAVRGGRDELVGGEKPDVGHRFAVAFKRGQLHESTGWREQGAEGCSAGGQTSLLRLRKS